MTLERRTLPQLLMFSCGLFAVQTFWGFNMATFPLYLNAITGSKSLTGIILSVGGIFGAVFPIFIGGLSDRIHTRWGRRMPFILAGWAAVLVSLLLLARTQDIRVVLPLSLVLYAGFFTVMGPYFALLPDLTPPEQRGTASGLMFLMGGLGVLSFMFLGARSWDVSPRLPFLWAVGGIVVSVAVLMAGTRELPPQAPSIRSGGLLRDTLRHRPVLVFLAAMACWWTGLWMVFMFFVIAVREMLAVNTERAVTIMVFMIAVFCVSALPAGMLGDRFGQRRVTAIGLVLLIVGLTATGLAQSLAAVWVMLFFGGIGYAAVLTVAYTYYLRMVPPEQSAGYMGLYMACQNGALLTGPAIGGFVIDLLGPRFLFFGAAAFVAAGLALLLLRQPSGKGQMHGA